MATPQCAECGKDVSPLAKKCPHCGSSIRSIHLPRTDATPSPFSPEAELISRHRFQYIKQKFPLQLLISGIMFVIGTLLLFESYWYRVNVIRIGIALLLLVCSAFWFYRLSRRARIELPVSIILNKRNVPVSNSLLFYVLAFLALVVLFFSLAHTQQ